MPAVDGRSLWPALLGEPNPEQHSETYSEHLGGIDAVPSCMIRRGPWKLYKYHDRSPPVLYNLQDDPEEMVDLGLDPRYEEVRDDLLARLYGRWNPVDILRESARQDRDMRLLESWGKAVQLLNQDQLLVPDVEDVTLV
jgi:arylsulfatase A-like enzyme